MFNFLSKKFKIAQVSSPEEPVPPKNYGGIERVVSELIDGQTAKGYEVDLYASGESTATVNQLFSTTPFSTGSYKAEMNQAWLQKAYRDFAIGKIVNGLSDNKYDVVHNHIGWQLLLFERQINQPIITTIHGPLTLHNQHLIYHHFKDYPFVSISNNQRSGIPDMNYIATVYNGIPVERFTFNPTPSDYVVFLSRVTPKKGIIEAIEFAKKAKVKLKIAGNIHPTEQEFFDKEIKPNVDGTNIEFVGEVNHEQKNVLLGGAIALIGLIQWEEPFGLFIVEAMATGTPVIATRRGSVPELVEDGETGFVVDDVDDAVRCFQKIHDINRQACRDHVVKNFSVEKMLDGYDKAYDIAIEQFRKSRANPWYKS